MRKTKPSQSKRTCRTAVTIGSDRARLQFKSSPSPVLSSPHHTSCSHGKFLPKAKTLFGDLSQKAMSLSKPLTTQHPQGYVGCPCILDAHSLPEVYLSDSPDWPLTPPPGWVTTSK